jgi:hypothetical protein
LNAQSTSRRLSTTGRFGCGLVFALFWSAMTLAMDVFIVWNAYQQIRAGSYATTTGSITQSEVEEVPGNPGPPHPHGPTYRPKIRYRYSVAGKEYEGTQYCYGQWSSGGGFARRIAAALPLDSQVEVHFAPGDPRDAVLVAGLQGVDLFAAMFMLPFNLVMLGFWVAIGGKVRQRLPSSAPAGAGISDEERFVRVRLSLFGPFAVGAAAAGGLAFGLVFLVAFGLGADPSMATMVVLWGVILGGGLLASLLAWRRRARGGPELVIDNFRRTIKLPRMFGREEEVEVPAEKIVSIDVEPLEKRGSHGSISRSYVTTVAFTERDGSLRREKLVEWPIGERAERLASWLRERLGVKPAARVDA